MARNIYKSAMSSSLGAGKLRANIMMSVDLEEDEVKEIALTNENVARHLENKNIIKVIFIKNKLINFVHT